MPVNNLQLMKFGPLPIRILVGVALIAHGWPKISDIIGYSGFLREYRVARRTCDSNWIIGSNGGDCNTSGYPD